MKSAALRADAENLFTRHGRSIDEVAAALHLSKGTLARWSKAGNWVARRQEFLKNSPTASIETLKKRRVKIIELMGADDASDAKLTDQLWKLTKVLESLEARADAIGPILDVMEKFARFVAQKASDESDGSDSSEPDVIRRWTEQFLDQERRNAYA